MKGTIQQRGVRTWRIRYDVPSNSGRKQVSETVRGAKRDAQRILRNRLSSIDRGTYIERTKEKVSHYLNRWLEIHSNNVSIRTYVGYQGCLKRLNLHLGTLNLQKLNPDHIQTTYKKMVDSGLSARTVLHSHRVLNVALKDAVKWGHLVNNPASKVDPPKPKKKEMEVWDAEAVSRFMKAASPSPYYSAFSLAVLTGMRRSELAGLKWSDIDLESKRLHITRTRQRISGLGIVEGPPKTHRSSRSIALSELAMKTFIRVRNKQSKTRLLLGATWPNTDYVFTYETGEPIDPETLTKEFKRIVRRNGLSHGTLHGLRHAFATALLTQNVHPAVVQSALGHSSIGITIDTYSHVIPGLEEAAARTIDQALGIAFAKEA